MRCISWKAPSDPFSALRAACCPPRCCISLRECSFLIDSIYDWRLYFSRMMSWYWASSSLIFLFRSSLLDWLISSLLSELIRKFLLWCFLKLRRRWFQKFVLRWSWWNLFSFPHHCIFLSFDYFWLRSSRSTLTLSYNIGSHYDFQFKLTNLCFLALLPKSLKSILLRKRQLAWRSLY